MKKKPKYSGILFFLMGFFLWACPEPQENKLYVLSPSTQELHIFNAENLSPIVAQPLSFTGVGTPNLLRFNPQFHQLLITLTGSNQLVRIGTEPPFDYKPLPFTFYGGSTDTIIDVLPNMAQENNVVLSTTSLFLIDEYGSVKSPQAPTGTPTPTATPTPTTPRTTTPAQKAGPLSSVPLRSGCIPTALALNHFVEYGASSSENSDTTEDTSSEGSSEDTTESSATSESEVKSPVTENEGKPVGGDEIAVACQGTNEIIFYDGATLDIKLSPDLGTGVSPMAITFIRTPDEKGEAVTGTYAVWNANNTLSLIKNGSGLTVAGSPFVFSGTSPVITATGQNIKKGLVLTGYMDGTNSFIDVRDSNGSSFLSSPYGLLNDCQGTGPAGIHTEFMDLEPTQEEIDAGFPEFDIWIYYTCPNTGFIGGLSANLGITFLVRRVPGNVLPGPIQGKPEGGVLYVGLTGTDAPAPGVLVLNQNSLTDAILGVSFLQGSPTQLLVVP